MTFIPFHQPWLGVPERLRLFLAWLLAIVSAGIAIVFAWTIYDHEGRADGNRGHRWIDFGGQWLMGRMILEGRGFELYHVTTQLEVLNRFYPVSDQAPDEKNRDSEELMSAFMIGESDDRGLADATYDAVFVAKEHWGWRLVRSNIGGPLYPPLQAVYYAPFAFLRPQPGYRAMQILSLVLVFVCGYLVYGLTHGRVWWPVASVAVMIFPGFGGAINLGQNPMLTLTLLLFGWRQPTGTANARGHLLGLLGLQTSLGRLVFASAVAFSTLDYGHCNGRDWHSPWLVYASFRRLAVVV